MRHEVSLIQMRCGIENGQLFKCDTKQILNTIQNMNKN